MGSRSLEDLSPHIRQECIKHMQLCKEHGLDVFLICTYRPDEEQESLFKQGRKLILGKWVVVGKTVTKARAGQSAHNNKLNGKPASLAYDLGIFTNGKINWNTESPDWQLAGHLGESIFGIQWYGNPKSKYNEGSHFTLKNWEKYKR